MRPEHVIAASQGPKARGFAVLLLLAAALLGALLSPARAHAAFGVSNFVAEVRDQDGNWVKQAGAHPYVGVVEFTMNTTGGTPDDNLKDVRVDVPPGLISNPEATPKCTDVQYAALACPPSTQLGTEEITALIPPLFLPTTVKVPIYNMVPPPGRVSDFAFGIPLVAPRTDILGGVRSSSDYGLYFEILDIPQSPSLITSKLSFWGVPADPAHDAERGQSCTPTCTGGGNPSTAEPIPFITNPTRCAGRQTTTLTVDSHQNPDQKLKYTALTPEGASGCDKLKLDASLSVSPTTTKRDSPAGLEVNLHVPQDLDPDHLGTSHVKDASLTLPPGLTLNPPAGSGLEACADEQFPRGSGAPVTCPAASKIGTVSIASHALSAPLTGDVYVGKPLDGNRYRIFVSAAGSGIFVRLEGKVTPDPATGQLTTTFSDNPELPFTDFRLTFTPGPHAVVATPLACGEATSQTTLVPWSGNAAMGAASAFTVDADGAGAACAATPFSLGFTAGTSGTQAGAFTSFALDVTRADGNQYLSKIALQQPPGLLGMLSSVTLCGEPEASQGTCPEASFIGTATTASGAGPDPLTLSGPVYITGPYNGAPFGLSVAIRAIAGPYDLGTVVVRSAIRVDPSDAHLTIESDPLPTIVGGVPLRLRRVAVNIDRGQFIFNPTSCSPLAIAGSLTSTEGAVQQASSGFQASGCDQLGFTPQMRASSSGKASLTRGAPLTVTLTQPAGQANLRSVAVTLPRELQSRGTTLARACLEATYDADPARCPEASRVGTATAVTPVLSMPLTGTAYLVAHGGGTTLPSLQIPLSGQGVLNDLRSTTTTNGRLTSTFPAVPDVPVTSFKVDLPMGSHSALATRANLCAQPLALDVKFTAQSGAATSAKVPIEMTDCGLKVISRTVKGRTATLTIQLPRPGKVTVSGGGLRSAQRTAKTAGVVKVKVKLSKKGVKSLQKRRRRQPRRKLTVTATVRLVPAKPASGAQSGATMKTRTRLVFR